jgi:hypothetical protein
MSHEPNVYTLDASEFLCSGVCDDLINRADAQWHHTCLMDSKDLVGSWVKHITASGCMYEPISKNLCASLVLELISPSLSSLRVIHIYKKESLISLHVYTRPIIQDP